MPYTVQATYNEGPQKYPSRVVTYPSYQDITYFFIINNNFERKVNICFKFCTRTVAIYFLTNMPIEKEACRTLVSNLGISKLYLLDCSKQ